MKLDIFSETAHRPTTGRTTTERRIAEIDDTCRAIARVRVVPPEKEVSPSATCGNVRYRVTHAADYRRKSKFQVSTREYTDMVLTSLS